MSANATWRVILASLVAGCGFHSTPGTGASEVDAPMADAAGASDTPADDGCLRDALVTVCLPPQPAPLVLTAGAIDTDTSPLCLQGLSDAASGYCVVAGSTITLAAGVTISAHGPRPLVLASPGAITIAGTIDVAGHQSSNPQAAGAGAAVCTAGMMPDQAGGGYGGSFGSVGGAGGKDADKHLGGLPTTFVAPTTFRGGCSGQAGGNSGASGGGGGGAIAILSKVSIQIDGTINASGGGGNGAASSGRGGGGGGAGGMIVIDAPSVTTTAGAAAKIYANGGSGGEGSGGNTGRPGNDPPADPTARAAGGAGGTSGGDGGNGAINGTGADPGSDGTSAGGGGGGGGGVGAIHHYGSGSLPGTVSPVAG